jgi:transcriptional regulator with XRE-family HTH domain
MSKKIAKRVGERVRQLRRASGFTQAGLAERGGLTTQAVSRIERGTRAPTLETLDKLAAALGVSLGALADAAAVAPRARTLPDDLLAIVEPLRDQPTAVRARAARVVSALIDE